MRINIEIENQNSLRNIQREFEKQLSSDQIMKATALALNDTSRRVITRTKSAIRKTYTVNKKYMDRLTFMKPAKGTTYGLYVEIHYKYTPVPLIGFKYKSPKRTKIRPKAGGVRIEVLKGQSKMLNHAFIATMRSGHTGVFGNGYYKNGEFIHSKDRTGSGKTRITELRTASPFTMGRNKDIERSNIKFIESTLPERTRAILQRKIDNMSK